MLISLLPVFLRRLLRGLGGLCQECFRPGHEIDWCLQHRVMSRIADLLDFGVGIESRKYRLHHPLTDAVVMFAIEDEHRRLDLSGTSTKVVLDEGTHIALKCFGNRGFPRL